LKELGFDETCFAVFPEGSKLLKINGEPRNWNDNIINGETTSAPTFSQAFRWFREKKLCDGSVCRYGEADGGYSYRWDILHEYGVYEERHFKKGYKNYEEAEQACLDELIEIVKDKQHEQTN